MKKTENIIKTRIVKGVLYQVLDGGELKPIKSKTDKKKLRAKSEAEVEKDALSDPDAIPTDASFWQDAEVERPGRSPVYMNLDSDVLSFYRAQGRGYQALINKVLRYYMKAKSE